MEPKKTSPKKETALDRTFDLLLELSAKNKTPEAEEPKGKTKKKFLQCEACSEFFLCTEEEHQKHKQEKNCQKCGSLFRCAELLKIHESYQNCKPEERTVSAFSAKKKRSACEFCHKVYRSEAHHFSTRHSTCIQCKKKFQCRGLYVEHKAECCKFLQCQGCGRNMSSKSSLKDHRKERPCRKCPYVSECVKQFRQHRHQGCSEEIQDEVGKSIEDVVQEEDKTVSGEEEMEIPVIPVEEEQISECEEVAAVEIEVEEVLQIKPQVQALLLKKCQFCSMLCTTEDIFANHVQSTECPRCGIEQPCNALLAQHMNTCSDDRRTEIRCPECDKMVKSRRKLESHRRRRHWLSQMLDDRILQLLEQRRGGQVRGQVSGVVVKSDPADVIIIE
ncbi:zinc finger protein 320-like isoform X2 [Neocloeon triangulifer]|uniref:zinc finger protein 320-like isoform X2 n=1 Tax=Neocloeon triangulifer TaxID=2078957 RepID=UPI00286F4686|nr:zinc finger protein 320-like isoform X2 [Neocloeon triangulifer]